MAINYVDYDSMEEAAKSYAREAEAVDTVINTLMSTNNKLKDKWKNKTAEAFFEQFETNYKGQLKRIQEEIQKIPGEIREYVEAKQREDEYGARGSGQG